MRTAFAKYEGAGNDFILVDTRDNDFRPDAVQIARLCDRHFGIGADGLMTLSSSRDADCTMRYYNADGSEGEMCGNGARCFALFAEHLGIGGPTKRFDATDGRHEALVLRSDARAGEIEVGLIDVDGIAAGDGWWFLNTGVPHYVEFVDDTARVDVVSRGREIRYDLARFPQGTNVDFVQFLGPGRLRMRTYERGVEAETLACGTGAAAAALVAYHTRKDKFTKFRVLVPGGELHVAFDPAPGNGRFVNIRLTGPARRIFEGTFDTADL